MFRVHPDTDSTSMNETDLIKYIKHLAVIVESELVHRIKMSEVTQTPAQGCRKLAPLAPPVPDKSHLVGQNEILKKKILDIL